MVDLHEWGVLTGCRHGGHAYCKRSTHSSEKNTHFHLCKQPQLCCPFRRHGVRTIPAGYMRVGESTKTNNTHSIEDTGYFQGFNRTVFESCKCVPLQTLKMFLLKVGTKQQPESGHSGVNVDAKELQSIPAGGSVWEIAWRKVQVGFHCHVRNPECLEYEC